ncbi:hypothetical protein AAFF_G00271290 [Aldrovandia affinis]|uniref:Uncharacterized protein n=1 Tax=Aldrovandia affinis TaxID=143900 RepID=A0AAD7RAT7_9TELE|nr:hypothetical protein AAFF_G00271290 [Aldrovandia affinis]
MISPRGEGRDSLVCNAREASPADHPGNAPGKPPPRGKFWPARRIIESRGQVLSADPSAPNRRGEARPS